MMDATSRPKVIRDVASEFVNEILGGPDYVALHWRYDKDDWYKHCERILDNTQRPDHVIMHPHKKMDKCKEVADTAIGTLMGRFDSFLANLTEHDIWHSNTLYIASPVTQLKVILHMKRALVDRFNRKVYTTVDVLRFLRRKYSACAPKTLEYDLHDFLSLTEMELCSGSKVFVRSGGSSWSYNVEQERFAKLNSYNDTTNTFLISGDTNDIDIFD